MDNYEKTIMDINAKIKTMLDKNTDEMSILTEMLDDMPVIKEILDNNTPKQLDIYCQKYTNFFYFAKLLENLASKAATAKA
ncbi:hypothetical protein [Cysteiniphilum sp. QT6929]|uniref:hypothetical protein n=1 Tax=Cysteiniphilum sp. QT6929 TaxID=2975055 RepID=UPI0024B33F05|nr:hypothetical protein [Cysteiniphilum sp. QT6929]WHN66780.1 hypothetical protein NYP54_11550 [Cysteiniphilum sp. QT6929]